MQIEQDKLGDVTRTHSAPSVSTWLCVVRDGASMPTPPPPSFYAIRSTPCPLCHLRLRQSRLMCQLLPRPRQSTWHPSAPVCPSAPPTRVRSLAPIDDRDDILEYNVADARYDVFHREICVDILLHDVLTPASTCIDIQFRFLWVCMHIPRSL